MHSFYSILASRWQSPFMAETLFSRTAFSISSGKLHIASPSAGSLLCAGMASSVRSEAAWLSLLVSLVRSAGLSCLLVVLSVSGCASLPSGGHRARCLQGCASWWLRVLQWVLPLAFLLASCLLLRRGLPSFSAGAVSGRTLSGLVLAYIVLELTGSALALLAQCLVALGRLLLALLRCLQIVSCWGLSEGTEKVFASCSGSVSGFRRLF